FVGPRSVPPHRTTQPRGCPMGVLQTLSVLALRQLVGTASKVLPFDAGEDVADGAVRFLLGRFLDPSQRVPEALKRSTDRAWRALEIALAGESLLSRLDRAEDKAFRQQVRAFLDAAPPPSGPRTPEWKQSCLGELRTIRKAKLHLAGPLDAEDAV